MLDYKKFLSPDRMYGIYPIIHGGVAARDLLGADLTGQGNRALDHVDRQRDRLDRCGFAGIVGNIPYGSGYPEDEAEWDATEAGIRGYINRGMKVWIYDEKGYPSGSAGGIVTERNPEFVALGLYCFEYWRTITGPSTYRADTPGDRLVCALLLPSDGGEPVDATQFLDSSGTLRLIVPPGSYHLLMMSERRLFDGTHAAESYSEPRNYISMSDSEAAKAFIAVTHDKYAERLSDEFGRGIPAFFTDEPSLISWNIRTGVYPILPWHSTYPGAFEKIYGYSFFLAAAAVITGGGPDKLKRRCDFWEFIGDTVADGFFGTIQDWCHQNNVKSSGHLLAEERLQSHICCYGSLYKTARRMDWPGIDQLNTEPKSLMYTGLIPIARLLASFADVYSDGESFTEFSDHTIRMAGKKAEKGWVYASVGWHLAQGINNFTSYYSFDGWSEDELRELNLYTARCGQTMRIGSRACTTVVLYPEASMWNAYTPSTAANAIDSSPRTIRLDDVFAGTSWKLLQDHIDYNYLDEDALCQSTIINGKLVFREREYSCIVLPAADVLRRSTANKLADASAAGVGIICVGCYPEYAREDGKPLNFTELFERQPALCETDEANMPAGLLDTGLLQPVISLSGDGARSVLTHVRRNESKVLVFACNMESKPFCGIITAKGIKSEIADPFTGETAIPAANIHNGNISVPLKIEPYMSKIIFIEQ